MARPFNSRARNDLRRACRPRRTAGAVPVMTTYRAKRGPDVSVRPPSVPQSRSSYASAASSSLACSTITFCAASLGTCS
jgi:hypothetical protein